MNDDWICHDARDLAEGQTFKRKSPPAFPEGRLLSLTAHGGLARCGDWKGIVVNLVMIRRCGFVPIYQLYWPVQSSTCKKRPGFDQSRSWPRRASVVIATAFFKLSRHGEDLKRLSGTCVRLCASFTWRLQSSLTNRGKLNHSRMCPA